MQISEMRKKIEEMFFDFEKIANELVGLNTRFTEKEYLSSGVNMLKNCLRIPHTTKTELFKLTFFESY